MYNKDLTKARMHLERAQRQLCHVSKTLEEIAQETCALEPTAAGGEE